MKKRIDQLLVERGLAPSREKAQRLVLAGSVSLNGQPVSKPGHQVADAPETVLAVREPERFVGRGGLKLEHAFVSFPLEVRGLACLDVGASTGGFTDCLLQHGAARVYAVDVGRSQLDWRLQQDARVVVMDGVNARYLTRETFPEAIRFAAVDVSFISLTRILPAVTQVLDAGAIVTLIKPQFEAGREQVGRGGVVRDEAVRARVVDDIRRFGTGELALTWRGCVESPIRGPAGNVEYLAYWTRS